MAGSKNILSLSSIKYARRLGFLFVATVVLLLANYAPALGVYRIGNGKTTERVTSVGGYDMIRVHGGFTVDLYEASEGEIRVKTDDNLHEYIKIIADDNTLTIRVKTGVDLLPRKGVHVQIPFEALDRISVKGAVNMTTHDKISAKRFVVDFAGSGDAELELESSEIEASITGSGALALHGAVSELSVDIRGSGKFRGFDMYAEKTDVEISGSGKAEVFAQNALRAVIKGTGKIAYKGNPEDTYLEAFGPGRISRR